MARVGSSALDDVVRNLIDAVDDGDRWRVLERWLREPDAPDQLARLKDESERLLTIDPRTSLQLARALELGAEAAERPGLRALGLLAMGDALRVLGRGQAALAAFDGAASAFLSLGDEVGWARTRIGRLWALMLVGRTAEGFGDVERARDIFTRHGEWLRAGALEVNLSIALRELARLDEAIDACDRALAFFERARRENPALGVTVELRIAKTLANKANFLQRRGDCRTALLLHEASRVVFARHGDTLSELRENRNLADAYAAQGHFSRALKLYEETFASLDRDGPPFDAAETTLNLAECYLRLNHVDRARAFAEDAAERFERLGLTSEAAKARFYGAAALARRFDVVGALELLDDAARAFAAAGLVVELAHVTLQRGQCQLAEGAYPLAIESATRARDLFADRGLVLPRCQSELVLARALLEAGDPAEAEELGRAVFARCDDHELAWLRPECQHLLALTARAQGDSARALQAFQTAAASIEQVQGRVATELRHYFLGDKARVFHDAVEHCLRLGETDLAFAFLERAKSRALADYVAGNLDVRPPAPDATTRALLDELTRLRGEHNWLYEQVHGRGGMPRELETRSPADRNAVDGSAFVDALQERERQITRLLERLDVLRAVDDSVGPRSAPESAPTDLGADVALVEYFFGPTASTAFVIADGRLVAIPLTARERDVARLANQWQLNLEGTAAAIARRESTEGLRRNASAILKAMHRLLLEPVGDVLRDRSRLIVVPFGLTHAVPFQALHDGTRFLVERHEVVVAPSHEVLRRCSARRRIGKRPALVVGHSDDGRLPAVVEEARAIASLFGGTLYLDGEATVSNVNAAAGQSGLIHLAAHGEARLDNPTFSHLKLADGRLTTVDVFGLDLDGAVVTLSACETGRVVVAGGDELIGLSRGFLGAGAATLIQSMWRVEDGSTSRLMGHFYHALRAGRTKGAALREAQLALLEGGAAHPFYWGAFQLIGDGGAL